jgi:prepilin-type N-terminal cleavage/methylation domain-containing protein
MPANKPDPTAGFTLVELMVTVAIIALVAGFTFAELNTNSYKLKTTAQTLKANLQKARLLAVKNSCPVYVDFDLDSDGGSDSTINNYYVIWKDLNNDTTFNMVDTTNTAVTNIINSVEFINKSTLPKGISFGCVSKNDGGPDKTPSNKTLPGDGVSFTTSNNRVKFDPQGTSSNGAVYLHNPANDEAGTHTIITNNIGRVRSAFWTTNGGKWR